uniref:Uncharacterized protein n=1 Tax=Bradyrhizobium ottawaense TaxID=931866 RepID=A0A2U8PHW0_9BRAD|nr:hypothetical protein CIT37_38565 [Bradyrhizobium ottawaense]
MTWEMFPRDEQTRVFVQQRLLTTIVVHTLTLLLLTALSSLWGERKLWAGLLIYREVSTRGTIDCPDARLTRREARNHSRDD